MKLKTLKDIKGVNDNKCSFISNKISSTFIPPEDPLRESGNWIFKDKQGNEINLNEVVCVRAIAEDDLCDAAREHWRDMLENRSSPYFTEGVNNTRKWIEEFFNLLEEK